MEWHFKHIAPRFAIILLTVFMSAFVYKKVFWLPELKNQGPMLFNLLEYQWHNDVLYFGESSNYWVSPDDQDKRTISDMINDSISGMRLSGLQVPAYHAGMFLPVINQIDPNSRVKSIVVTMNLRSFDKPWIFSTQEGALLRTKCFYYNHHPLYNRLCATLGFYSNPDADAQDKKMLDCFQNDSINVIFPLVWKTVNSWKDNVVYLNDDGSTNEDKQGLAHHYVKAYAFSIDTSTNPRIKDFDQIVNICKSKGIKLYLNILSENLNWADSLVGPDLVKVMKFNRDILLHRYSQKGAIIIDNLDAVPAECFGEKNWTTEHYNQFGRMIIARNVANVLMLNAIKPAI
ncbi:MAG: hypothetical protein IT245_07595 [Bacteroidia bacterium]|nr:hypothetical protein [Bacteroidia bacterium]